MNLKKINFLLLPFLLCLFLFSCKKERINANGNKITDVRHPGTFHHVHTSGSTPVFISYGTDYKVELKGSENLIGRYKTTVSGDELALGYEHLQLGNDDLKIYVTLPLLEKITLSGSAKFEINGTFPQQTSFSADISGSGNIELLGVMKADNTKINISGSGDAVFKNLVSKNAVLSISGNGDIRNSVTENLKAGISGSGNIYYTGNPVIDSGISGTGRVIKN